MKGRFMLVTLAMMFLGVPHAEAQMEAKAATLAVYESQLQVDAMRDDLCKAYLAGKPDAEKHYAVELKRAIAEYEARAGHKPALRPCFTEQTATTIVQ